MPGAEGQDQIGTPHEGSMNPGGPPMQVVVCCPRGPLLQPTATDCPQVAGTHGQQKKSTPCGVGQASCWHWSESSGCVTP